MSQDNEILIRTESNDRIELAGYSVIGDREEQQDYFGLYLDERGGMALICDGMGGQNGGSAAARKAEEIVGSAYRSCPEPQESLRHIIRAVREADRQIAEMTDEEGQPLGAGSTVTAVMVQDNKLGWCSVGDSRAYLKRGKEFVQFTRDQNYKAILDEQLKEGLIGENDYKRESRHGEALISYLGIGNLQLIDYSSLFFPLEQGDQLFIVSDGLYRVLSENEICSILSDMTCPEDALTALEQKSKERAESVGIPRDNTTAIIMIIK